MNAVLAQTHAASRWRGLPARGARWAEPLTYVTSTLLAALASVFALQLWRADLRVPFTYFGDAIAVAAHAKTVLQTGWYERQPLLGFPAGQTYHDFPTADNLNFVGLHVLGWFSGDWAVVLNLYLLVGFPLTALAMTWFLREVAVTRAATVALAVLYAIAPYHFLRGESHLWLASYYTVPLALVVVLRAVRGEPLWSLGRGSRAVRWASGRGAVTALSLAAVATASTYYAVFCLLLLAAAGIGAWLRERDWRRFGGVVAAGVVTVAVVLANMAPDVLYRMAHGTSATGLVRSPAEVEIYALKLAQLLLPVPGHRVPVLAYVRALYDERYPLQSEQPALGVVAGFGFVVAIVVVAVTVAVVGRRRAAALTAEQAARTTTIAHLSMLTLVAFLFATVGGLATFISFLTSALRGWNRMSIIIAALSLAITGLVLDAWVERLARSRGLRTGARRAAASALAALVLVVGYADQVTPKAPGDYAANARVFHADAAWFAQVESLLPAGAAVFQLPHAGFPETAPVNGIFDTDVLKGYLHTDAVHWSAGGIKGRPGTDWPFAVALDRPDQMARELAVLGFSAIHIDRAALSLEKAGPFEAALAETTGVSLATSADGRYALYDLRGVAERVRADNDAATLDEWRAALADPVWPYPSHEVGVALPPAQVWPDVAPGWTVPSGRTIRLANDRGEAVAVTVVASVLAPQASRVTFTAPGVEQVVAVGTDPADLTLDLEVPAGGLTLTVTSDTEVPVLVGGLDVLERGLPTLAG